MTIVPSPCFRMIGMTAIARVVDQHIDTAKVSYGLFHCAFDAGIVCHIKFCNQNIFQMVATTFQPFC